MVSQRRVRAPSTAVALKSTAVCVLLLEASEPPLEKPATCERALIGVATLTLGVRPPDSFWSFRQMDFLELLRVTERERAHTLERR